MIMSRFGKVIGIFASAMLLCGVAAGQTPPQDQHSLPQLPQARTLLLDLDLKLNSGAASTKERLVTLSFTAREKSDNITIGDATANVTNYRVLETENVSSGDLSNQPWIPVTSRPPDFALALRNGRGQRYGERRVMFQVKTDTLTSNVVSDTIDLEPVLKEYRVSASGNTHPLIQYAAAQGFNFPRSFYETCSNADCPGSFQTDDSIATGSAFIATQDARKGGGPGGLGGLPPPPPSVPVTCVTKAEYQLFFERSPNQFWRIKSVAVSNAYVRPHGVNRFLAKFNFENKDGSCLPPSSISVGDVIVE